MHWFFKYKLHHILFWTAYLTFWTWVSLITYKSDFVMALQYTGIWSTGQAAAGYAGMYWLVPQYFNTRQYAAFTLGLISVVVACSVYIIALMMMLDSTTTNVSLTQMFMYSCMTNAYTLVSMVAAKIIKERIVTDRRNQQLVREQMQQELSFLRAQMNPHFLFNAINSIYVLIRKDPEAAAQTLVKFSDMLRYQLYECNTEHIPIEKELNYLDHYIALEKLRKGDAVKINYNVSNTVQHLQIAPLLIIPFVENAFKHISSNSKGDNFIDISMDYNAPLFTLRVENSKDMVNQQQGPHGGIGQVNVQRRLELLYAGKHQLEIQDNGQKYLVLLEIGLI